MVGESVLRPDEVVVMFGYAPDSLSHGTPPMEALRQLLASYAAAEESRRGVLGGWRSDPRNHRAANKRAADFGCRDGAFAAGLGRSLQRSPVGWSYADSRRWDDVQGRFVDGERRRILGARKLTSRGSRQRRSMSQAPFVGILGARRSRISEQHKQLYADTLGPWLRLIEGELERQLVEPEFGARISSISMRPTG